MTECVISWSSCALCCHQRGKQVGQCREKAKKHNQRYDKTTPLRKHYVHCQPKLQSQSSPSQQGDTFCKSPAGSSAVNHEFRSGLRRTA